MSAFLPGEIHSRNVICIFISCCVAFVKICIFSFKLNLVSSPLPMDKQQITDQIKWMIADGNTDYQIEALLMAEGVARAEARQALAAIKKELSLYEYALNAYSNKRRYYLWVGFIIIAALALLLVFHFQSTNKLKTKEREITAADMMRLIDAEPVTYTAELNKVNPGWSYNPEKNRWVNKQRNMAIAIRMNELRLMGPVAYNFSFSEYLENHDFDKIIDDKPGDTSKAGKKIFENDKFMFTVQANEHYAMISLAYR